MTEAGFHLLPTQEILTHYVVEREGLIALVEKRPDGTFGSIGAPGILIDGTFAVLVWKQASPRLVAKGRELPATTEQVEALRRFSTELREALARICNSISS